MTVKVKRNLKRHHHELRILHIEIQVTVSIENVLRHRHLLGAVKHNRNDDMLTHSYVHGG